MLGVGFNSYLELFQGTDQYICSRHVGRGESVQIAMLCDSQLLRIIYLAEVHNVSFTLFNNIIPEERKRATMYDQFILSFVKMNTTSIKSRRTRIFVTGSAHLHLLYCIQIATTSSITGHQLWIHAFPREIWLLIFLTIFAAIIIFWKTKSLKIFYVVCLILGQEVSENSWRIIFFLIFFFLIRSFFENNITSLIVVPPGPTLYKNLREMVLDNVKILFNTFAFLTDKPYEVFSDDFQEAGVPGLVNKSFSILPEDFNLSEIVRVYLKQQTGTRYAFPISQAWADSDTYLINMHMMNQTRGHGITCHYLKQRFHPSFEFFDMVMMNKAWLMISLERMLEGGLVHKWDKWVNYLHYLTNKNSYREAEQTFSEKGFQVVHFDHLLYVCLFCAGMYFVAIVKFLLSRFKAARVQVV